MTGLNVPVLDMMHTEYPVHTASVVCAHTCTAYGEHTRAHKHTHTAGEYLHCTRGNIKLLDSGDDGYGSNFLLN